MHQHQQVLPADVRCLLVHGTLLPIEPAAQALLAGMHRAGPATARWTADEGFVRMRPQGCLLPPDFLALDVLALDVLAPDFLGDGSARRQASSRAACSAGSSMSASVTVV